MLAAALTRCYEDAGWDLVTGEAATPGLEPGYPSLEDLQATALRVVEEIGYGREITDNVRGFVTVRIASLRLGTTGPVPARRPPAGLRPAARRTTWSWRSKTSAMTGTRRS